VAGALASNVAVGTSSIERIVENLATAHREGMFATLSPGTMNALDNITAMNKRIVSQLGFQESSEMQFSRS
jgi:hypothetical protein